MNNKQTAEPRPRLVGDAPDRDAVRLLHAIQRVTGKTAGEVLYMGLKRVRSSVLTKRDRERVDKILEALRGL